MVFLLGENLRGKRKRNVGQPLRRPLFYLSEGVSVSHGDTGDFISAFFSSFFGKRKPHSHFSPFLTFNDFVAPVQNIYTLWLTDKLFNKCLPSVSVFNEF